MEIYHFQFKENIEGENYLIIKLTPPEDDEEEETKETKEKTLENLTELDIIYKLSEVHVCSNDENGTMTYCEDDEYYALNILHNKSRKIYFDNYNQMIAFLDKALTLQSFYTRLSQY